MFSYLPVVILKLVSPLWIENSDQHVVSNEEGSADPACMAFRCGITLAGCLLDSSCRDTINCMKSCEAKDAICQSDCFFEFSNNKFNALVGCAIENKCIAPMTWSNGSCPDMKKHQSDEVKFDIQQFVKTKEMYVARGSHPIYDCFACQRLQFSRISDTEVATRWSTVSRSGHIRDANYTLVQDSHKTLVTKYNLFGMPVEEHYYILDYTDDFVLYFYCGFGFSGEYQGALIYTRFPESYVPAPILQKFSSVLKRANLEGFVPDLNVFCRPSYTGSCINL